MNRLYLCLIASAAAFAAAADGPTDNLRADWRNPVRMYRPGTTSPMTNAVQLGLGSGVFWTTNRPIIRATGGSYTPTTAGQIVSYMRSTFATPNVRSTVGAPIAAASANKFLGEPLDPPEGWDGKAPVITPGTGGMAVWVDFAKKVITTQAGPIEVKWGLAGGQTNEEASVVAASPTKRPVRLYWTHERPSYISDQTAFRPLQNAGPTVQFGSNYKVHLYGTSSVKVLSGASGSYTDTDGTTGYYSQNDGKGYVRLSGGELQALEGSYGTFLIVYSRLDEALNERVMLAYEIVNVLEPTQTQIDVGIGDQLKPLTRSFDTNELFPWVTRGLTDDADNDEIYVYQHGSGRQKNFLWAIRDSSANPWKIEVFWRAKEELDVVWPFEVDIYSATWKDANAQVYIRNAEGHSGGEVEPEPKVFVPDSVSVEAMDYQVPKKHVHVQNGAFYTDYADNATYALLKYTAGDTVWFQTVKSVANRNTSSCWTPIAREITPHRTMFYADGKVKNFFYPGWIRRDFKTSSPNQWPVQNAFNADFYRYPTEWAPTNSLYSPIFPVNIGQLEVWWSKASNLNGEVREGSGHVEPLSTQMFFPTESCLYCICAPTDDAYYDTATPQIVLASGKGSAGWTLADQETEVYAPVMRIDVNETVASPFPEAVFSATVPGGAEDEFTIESWLSFASRVYASGRPSGPVQWLAFHSVDAENAVSPVARLSLAVDVNANIWVNGAKKTNFSSIPVPLFHNGVEDSTDLPVKAFHAALARSADGKFTWYVNGMPTATFAAGEDEKIEGGDMMRIFPAAASADSASGRRLFAGDWRLLRLWKTARSHQQIHDNRYVKLDPVDAMLVQYAEQEHAEGSTALAAGTLVDSSANASHAMLGFDMDEAVNPSSTNWINVVDTFSALIIPTEGRTFPAGARIYRQPDPEQDGYNPNEEHAFMVGNVAYALRCDLNKMSKTGGGFTSLPYVLVQYADPDRPGRYAMQALRVVPENDMYRFRTFLDAGSKIQSISPLDRFQPANLQKFLSGPEYAGTGECFKDRKDWYWAHQAGNDGGTTNYVFEFSYPHQEQFDYPSGDAPEVGSPVGWMEGYTGRDDWYMGEDGWGDGNTCVDPGFLTRPASDASDTPIDYTFIVKWPDDVKGLYVNDTLIDAKDGLPPSAVDCS